MIHSDVVSVIGQTRFFPPDRDGDGQLDYPEERTHPDHRYSLHYAMSQPIPGENDPIPELDRFSDRRVNSDNNRHQRRPAVARTSDGSFVVVWEDDSRGAEGIYQIYARGFDANGCELFGDRTINSQADGQQLDPDIAIDDQGDFVVVWEDDADENGFYQIVMRGFNADGTERFSQRTVNSVADGQQRDPVIAMSGSGDFVVAWEDDSNENGVYQIAMRGFDAGGAERFPQATVNAVSSGQQLDPVIGMDDGGAFVIAWEDDSDGNGFYEVLMRGFDPLGAESFSQRTVNAVSDGQQLNPDIAMSAGGEFAVVWQDDADENGFYQILVRGIQCRGRSVVLRANGEHGRGRPAAQSEGRDGSGWALRSRLGGRRGRKRLVPAQDPGLRRGGQPNARPGDGEPTRRGTTTPPGPRVR